MNRHFIMAAALVAMAGCGVVRGMELGSSLHGENIEKLRPVILLMANPLLANGKTDDELQKEYKLCFQVRHELRDVINLKEELDKPMNQVNNREKNRLVKAYLDNTAQDEKEIVSELMKTVGIGEDLISHAQEFTIGEQRGANYSIEQLERAGYLPQLSKQSIDPKEGVHIEVAHQELPSLATVLRDCGIKKEEKREVDLSMVLLEMAWDKKKREEQEFDDLIGRYYDKQEEALKKDLGKGKNKK